jgi:hypothetical protein
MKRPSNVTLISAFVLVTVFTCFAQCSSPGPDLYYGAWSDCHQITVYIDSRFSTSDVPYLTNAFQQWNTGLSLFGTISSSSVQFVHFYNQPGLVVTENNDTGTDVYQVIDQHGPDAPDDALGETGSAQVGGRTRAYTYLDSTMFFTHGGMQRVMAHEIGHTFAIADCVACYVISNGNIKGTSIMITFVDPDDLTTPAMPDGPTICDILDVQAFDYYWMYACDYFWPSSAAGTAPVACLVINSSMSFDQYKSTESQCSSWWDTASCSCQSEVCGMTPDDYQSTTEFCFVSNGIWSDQDCTCSPISDACDSCTDEETRYCMFEYGTVCQMSLCEPLCWNSPIIIETNAHAIRLSSPADGVIFDINANGHPARYSWPESGSGGAFLILDRNGNGTIDDGSEMFGSATPQPASDHPNGFLALAEFDKPENGGNGNGIIDPGDAIFTRLRLWIDENRNGISEPEELFTLSDKGVATISFDYKLASRRDRYGNLFRYRAKVNGAPGTNSGRWVYDVILSTVQRSAAISSSSACSAQQTTERPVPVEKPLSEPVRR